MTRVSAIGITDAADRRRACGGRSAHPGSRADASRPAPRRGCAGLRRDAPRAPTPCPSVPVSVPPVGEGGDGEPLRWWRRVPFGLVLTILLGVLVLYAALSQGEDPFGSHHHVSFRFL